MNVQKNECVPEKDVQTIKIAKVDRIYKKDGMLVAGMHLILNVKETVECIWAESLAIESLDVYAVIALCDGCQIRGWMSMQLFEELGGTL